MIKIKNLNKSYGDLKVLEDISIEISDGGIYGLVGQSGAGKSTLLRCINGLERYDGGMLSVNGVEVKDLDDRKLREFRKNIGMIFQHFSLMERKTVYENIALPMKCWGYEEKEIKSKVNQLLNLVGIEEKINDKPRTLSGGQKQRVAIARALSMDPKILLCDEATSSLDPKTATSVLNLLKDINEKLGITIVVVTHQMEVVRQICTNVALLEKGVVAANGKVEEIFLNQPKLLENLLGKEEDVLPEQGRNIRIIYNKGDLSKPIVSMLARELDVNFSVVWGKLEKYRDEVLGSIVINVEDGIQKEVTDYLSSLSVDWEVVEND